ncbi:MULTISPECIES: hypothetical protein [unclassified Streptomyces]|uniref:hypothetical protein n=1 Tax=unclassified Streptomyces TaxID=2593676 RepID=UPI002E18A6D3
MPIRDRWPWHRRPDSTSTAARAAAGGTDAVDGTGSAGGTGSVDATGSAGRTGTVDATGAAEATATAHTDQAALAWLCAHLPELREKADRFAWRAALDREVAEVRAGKSAAEALRALDLRRDGYRSSGLPAADSWQERPVVEWFRCPSGRCPARGRDADASEPRCHIDGALMPPQDGG